jgi:hypothetical protein
MMLSALVMLAWIALLVGYATMLAASTHPDEQPR